MLNNPPNAEEVLNFGGIIGYSIYVRIDSFGISFPLESIKSPHSFVTLPHTEHRHRWLAFIFELTRNLILVVNFGGMFGVVDTPREIRAEKAAQARQLTFAFAGFSAIPCCC